MSAKKERKQIFFTNACFSTHSSKNGAQRFNLCGELPKGKRQSIFIKSAVKPHPSG